MCGSCTDQTDHITKGGGGIYILALSHGCIDHKICASMISK